MEKIKRYLLAAGAAIAISVPNTSKAVMAYPGLMPMTQSDGTTLMVQLKGDERAHAYFSEDGYLLICNGQDFYYANFNENGEVTRSSVKANNLSARTSAENAFLNTIDKQLVIETVEKQERQSAARKRFAKTASSGMVAPSNPVPGLFPGASYPSIGSPKSLVILVEYSDLQFTTENAHDYFTKILSQANYTENGFTGSALDFYSDSSNGQFTPQFDVVGPVALPKTQSYYGGNKVVDGYSYTDYNVREMVVDACDLLDSTVDFSQYDTDGDGIIDNVFIFYAGRGEASGGGEDTVWPHSWSVSTVRDYDGVRLNGYACSNELTIQTDENGQYFIGPDAIGTFCHEFGHVIGLPDLYSTSYNSCRTPDGWDTMCSGSYNNNSRTPPTFSSWERACLGWLNPVVLEKPGYYTLKNNIQNTNAAYLIPTSSANEFFMLENRFPEKWDAYVFGDVQYSDPSEVYGNGMLVWHIDYDQYVWRDNVVNDDPDWQCVDIVEAHGYNATMHDWDAFPGGPGDEGLYLEFNYDSKPQLADWNGNRLDIGLSEIYEDPDTRDVTFLASSLTQSVKSVGTAETNIRVEGMAIANYGTEAVTVYNVAGAAVATIKAGESFSVPTAGIYLVKGNAATAKVLVK